MLVGFIECDIGGDCDNVNQLCLDFGHFFRVWEGGAGMSLPDGTGFRGLFLRTSEEVFLGGRIGAVCWIF